MTRTFTNRRYLDAAADPVVVFDGTMGTSIQKLDLFAADFGGEKLGGCNDYLFIAKPEAIESIHTLFLAAGCEAVETDTFRANRITLREYGLQDRITEINRAAAQLARCVCDRFARETGAPVTSPAPSGQPECCLRPRILSFPTSRSRNWPTCLPSKRVDRWKAVRIYSSSRHAIRAARIVCDLPIVAQMTFTLDGRTSLGHQAATAHRHLAAGLGPPRRVFAQRGPRHHAHRRGARPDETRRRQGKTRRNQGHARVTDRAARHDCRGLLDAAVCKI
jgi:hypothetical protein